MVNQYGKNREAWAYLILWGIWQISLSNYKFEMVGQIHQQLYERRTTHCQLLYINPLHSTVTMANSILNPNRHTVSLTAFFFQFFFSLLTSSFLALGLFWKSRFNFPHLKITLAAYICFSSCLNSLLCEFTMPLSWNAFTESLRTENFTLVENEEGYEWLSLSFWSREAFYEIWNIFTFP